MKQFITDSSIFLFNKEPYAPVIDGEPYPFKINLFTNPVGHGFYLAYLKKHNIPKWIGLTDKQRKELEEKIKKLIVEGRIIVE